ncbi:MAG: hypothetical protein R3242_00365 [Akkermansiaceae bacterium]|nr:hypothetical protein [Akkermansiaceae bacterium]
MKSTLGHAVLAFAFLAPLVAHAEHYKVFILGGQSNMYGADSKLEALPEGLQKRQDDVLLYSGSEFSRLKPGSGRVFFVCPPQYIRWAHRCLKGAIQDCPLSQSTMVNR